MRSIASIIATLVLFAACKAPSYHYVSPTLNYGAYSQSGAGQLGVHFGSIGLGAKGGVAVSEHVNINGFFGGFPETDDSYTSRESEISVGYQTSPVNKAVTSFYVGMGVGNNEKDKTGLSGNYNRPFLQIQRAVYDREIFGGNVYFDGSFGLRLNYLMYNGRMGSSAFDENVFYTEPYFGIAIGGKNVRFELMNGFAIKSSGTWAEDVRIFPVSGSIGVLIKLRKAAETANKIN